MRVRATPTLLVLTSGMVASCSSEPAPRAAPRTPLTEAPAFAAPAFPTPATWRFHPRAEAAMLAQASLPDGSTLFAGKDGERWRVGKGGPAEPAVQLAPEDLVAIVAKSDGEPGSNGGGYLFLGKSGTSYAARDPLGPFERSTAPLEPLVRVHAAGRVLVGVRRDGALLRSDSFGASWQRVGPADVRFADVAIGRDGRGLALAVPEALWETADFGATFRAAAVAPFGVQAMTLDDPPGAPSGIVLSSPLGARRWTPGKTALEASGKAPAGGMRSLGAPPPLGPSAFAFVDGRAVVENGRWLEVRSDGSTGWHLLSGAIDKPLSATKLPANQGCADVRLAAFGNVAYLACARQRAPNVTQPFQFQRSTDGGKTWKAEPYLVEGQSDTFEMAAGADEALVVSGVCPAETRGPGCRPVGVQTRRVVTGDAGATVALVPAATPSLAGAAAGLAFSVDGRIAYAFGARSKGDAFAVFVSRDGGRSFEARDVESLTAAGVEESRTRGKPPLESISPSEDGTVALVLQGRAQRSWLVVDEDGRTLSVARPPVDTARIGAVGQRAIAMDPGSREAWESLDGGAAWTPIGRLPVDPCPGNATCNAPIACSPTACFLGDSVTRIGFREAPRSVLLSPPATDDRSRRAAPRVGTTLSCTLDAGEWQRLPGVAAPPAASQAALGKAAFAVAREEPSLAAVSVVRPRAGAEPKLEEVTLFAPVKRPEDYAFLVSAHQIEGVAAIRYAVPGLHGSRDATLRDVELAWDAPLFGQTGHGVIPEAGTLVATDFTGASTRARQAAPGLLSITSGGLYVRVHAWNGENQPTFFVDARESRRGGAIAVQAFPAVPWPDETRGHGHSDATHVGHAHVPIWISGTTVVRARPVDTGFSFDAVSLGYTDPMKAFGIEQTAQVAYLGDRAGFFVLAADRNGGGTSGAFRAFRSDAALFEAPIRVPSQADLPAMPRPCSVADRAATPRVVVPFQPGTRHAVLVTDPVEPMRTLLTGDAVLHGTPESPCAAAYDAVLVSSDLEKPERAEQALLSAASLEHSWLFRMASPSRETVPVLEYRTMSCRWDPSAEVPVEVFREPGTLVDAH